LDRGKSDDASACNRDRDHVRRPGPDL